MKKILILSCVCSSLSLVYSGSVRAQSLKDILKSEKAQQVLQAVKKVTAFKWEDLQGTWQYKSAACQFKSDDLLQQAGGVALAEGVEQKLEAAYQKVGIKAGNFSYTFCKDSTFTCQIGKKKLNGTYTYDASQQMLVLSYFRLFKADVQLNRSSDGITLLYNADHLLKLVTVLSSYSKSSTLSAVNKVAEQYDGMLLGFDLKR